MDSEPLDQNRNQYIEVMGRPLGEVYYELWQELVWLYTKWGQYILLFDSAERVALLNKSAPTFFYIFQKSFLEDITLHIARMTDPAANKQGEKNLSFRQICCLVDQEKIPNEELTKLMKDLDTKTEFVKKWRHKKIAHRDLKFALSPSTNKLQKFSNAEILKALQAMANESPRILRRLHTLRRWSHEQEIKPFFTRGARTRCSYGARTPRRIPISLGHH